MIGEAERGMGLEGVDRLYHQAASGRPVDALLAKPWRSRFRRHDARAARFDRHEH